MKTVCREDYEIYKIPIPIFLRGKKKRSYLIKELEKRHPCFSTLCCFDSRLSLCKGKTFASVAVMDALKLSEYQKKNLTLHFQETGRKFFFVNKKRAVCLFFIFLVFACISFFVLQKLFNSFSYNKIGEEICHIENNVNDEESGEENCNMSEMIFYLLNSIKVCNGKIISGSFESDSGKLIFLVKNCFPENLRENLKQKNFEGDFAVQEISYVENIPVFTLTLSVGKRKMPQEAYSGNLETIRNAVFNHSGLLIRESNETSQIAGSIPQKEIPLFLKELDSIRKKGIVISNWKIEFFTDKMNFTFEISKSDVENFLLVLADFPEIFDLTVPQKSQEIISRKTTLPAIQTKEKLGSVLTKDGKRIVFYRTAQGKIQEVEE